MTERAIEAAKAMCEVWHAGVGFHGCQSKPSPSGAMSCVCGHFEIMVEMALAAFAVPERSAPAGSMREWADTITGPHRDRRDTMGRTR